MPPYPLIRGRPRTLLLALALAALMLASGCSMVRFAYSQLDTYAAWKADEYFDLDAAQEEQFMARFERLHRWHRHEELPDYARLLIETHGRFRRGLDAKDVLWATEAVKERYRTIVRHAAGDAAALLMTVTPSQIDALKRKWADRNEEFIHEHALNGTEEDQRRASLRRNLERIRHWTGPLGPEQETRIAAMLFAIPDIDRMRYEDRLRRQREFLMLMQQRDDEDAFAERLRNWLLHWERGRDPAYARRLDQFTQMRAQAIAEIGRMLTSQQHAHVSDRLQGYIAAFRSLAQRGVRAAGR